MNKTDSVIDPHAFERMLSRNVKLPLLGGLFGAVLFVALIAYLLSVIGWVEHTDRVTHNVSEAQRLSVDLETGMRGFVITGDDSFLSPYDSAQPQIAKSLALVREMVKDNPAQAERIDRITTLQAAWNQYASEVIALRRNGGDYLTAMRRGQGKRLTDAMRADYAEVMNVEQQLRFERNNQANNTSLAVIAAFLLFTLTLTGLLAYFGRRQLVRLSEDYGRTLARQEAAAAELAEQAWVRSRQTELAGRLVGELGLRDAGAQVLEFFARHVDSPVGALYVRDGDGAFVRIASHGFSREAEDSTQVFAPNQGLVGQAAVGRRLLRAEPLSADYLQVNSGLGHMAPTAVLLLPVAADGQVNGVVELGFLSSPEGRTTELLELVADDIANAISAARYREQLQEVLAETQQLNEELQVQQEELRTSNEELEEQSRALRESQATLENQQAELEQTNDQLAERTEALDLRNAALRRVQADLEDRASELQRASRYKSEFLANMSHELRTPLNSALILSKLLVDNPQGNLTPEQVRFAQSIHSSGNDLLELINDILDIAKVESGKLDIVVETVPLAALADSLSMTFAPLASQKQLDFRIEVAPDAPPTLVTDRHRVEQILKNLLANAIKFTEHGTVSLAIGALPGGGASFAITDSGIGIAADQQELIFEAFRQADGTTSRRYGGTGLGLSISRDLTRLLGGTLGVRSTPGAGSTFTLGLPATAPQAANGMGRAVAGAAPPPGPAEASRAPTTAATGPRGATSAFSTFASPPPAPRTAPRAPAAGAGTRHDAPVASAPPFADDRLSTQTEGRRVLVIEDEPQFAHILYDLAHEHGYRCLVAHGAHDGFDLAVQFLPDAVLLDMRLPDAPGLSVLQRLKDEPRTRHIPVHVISGTDHVETALHMGAIGYAMKPTSREQLRQVFDKFEQKLTQKLKSVLLVEDDAIQREAVTRLIGDEDIAITAVESGEEAMALLHERVFDVMITDLRLPDMQGSDLLKRMSSEDIRSFPPVIVYTGRNLTRDEESELMRYSRSIIIKGARSPERLLDEVTLFLHKVEADMTSERRTMLRTARGRDRVFEGRRVLLVDDDVRNIFALTSALEQRGAIVEIGRNGREALEKLDRVPDIDLVLMDVMMPEMDGLEATRRLRQDPRFAKLPVITITAKAMKDDQEQCLAAGASDYLAKPVDLDRLFSLMRVWMPRLERL